MAIWLQTILAAAGLVVLAPLMAWVGHKHGRSIKGGVALASILLGFGLPLDPPVARAIEAVEGEEEGAEAAGDPKIPRSKVATKRDG